MGAVELFMALVGPAEVPGRGWRRGDGRYQRRGPGLLVLVYPAISLLTPSDRAERLAAGCSA